MNELHEKGLISKEEMDEMISLLNDDEEVELAVKVSKPKVMVRKKNRMKRPPPTRAYKKPIRRPKPTAPLPSSAVSFESQPPLPTQLLKNRHKLYSSQVCSLLTFCQIMYYCVQSYHRLTEFGKPG